MKYLLALFLTLNSLAMNKTHEISFHKSKWEVLSYSSIKANTFDFKGQSMTIGIDGSASPLIYPFQSPVSANEISFKAKIEGDIDFKGQKQGEKGADDFLLRIGLVYEGDQTLNWFQKKVAASWILKLFNLAPKGTGVSHIHFLNVYSQDALKGQKREHPLSELLIEQMVAKKDPQGFVSVTVPLVKNKKILALWISSDGDDTKAKFKVQLESIVIK